MEKQDIQSLYKRVQNTSSVASVVALLSAVKDQVADVRTPLRGLTPDKDTVLLRMCIIEVVNSMLIIPLSPKATDHESIGDADNYR